MIATGHSAFQRCRALDEINNQERLPHCGKNMAVVLQRMRIRGCIIVEGHVFGDRMNHQISRVDAVVGLPDDL